MVFIFQMSNSILFKKEYDTVDRHLLWHWIQDEKIWRSPPIIHKYASVFLLISLWIVFRLDDWYFVLMWRDWLMCLGRRSFSCMVALISILNLKMRMTLIHFLRDSIVAVSGKSYPLTCNEMSNSKKLWH